MKLAEVPAGSRYFDVDGVPVVLLPGGLSAIAFRFDQSSYPFPNVPKVRQEGDEVRQDQFAVWLSTGKAQFA